MVLTAMMMLRNNQKSTGVNCIVRSRHRRLGFFGLLGVQMGLGDAAAPVVRRNT
jgi:hypothetical protein